MAEEESGYVHRPGGDDPDTDGETATESDDGADFGRSGWILVAMIAVAFLLVPGAILLLPSAQGVIGMLGLTLRDAYLTLPLVPAFALGALAVWSAVRSRSD